MSPRCRDLLNAIKVGGFKLGTEPAEMELVARVERVLALHKKIQPLTLAPDYFSCDNCHYDWPCKTVRLLNGEKP